MDYLNGMPHPQSRHMGEPGDEAEKVAGYGNMF